MLLAPVFVGWVMAVASSQGPQLPATGTEIIDPNALATAPVYGLERTDSVATLYDLSGPVAGRVLRVKVQKGSTETNATQLTIPTKVAVKQGDTLVATFLVRGKNASGGPSHLEFLFEKATEPWTKSIIKDIDTTDKWTQVRVPFAAADSYAAGTAMASFRFAFGPQLVELWGPRVTDYGTTISLEDATEAILDDTPVGPVDVTIDAEHPMQTMLGFGGDFCQARYGSTEVIDSVGTYALGHLDVRHARVGLPLNYWEPKPGEFHDDAQAAASMQLLGMLAKRGIPTVVSIWEAPGWLLGGSPEQSGRVLPPEKYADCIDAIVRYLTLARDKYGAKIDYLTFNEPDYGVNFKFTSETMRNFVRQAGPKIAAAGLKTKFLVGDTGGGANYVAYASPILSDPTIADYLGPISFHCWDVLTSTAGQYEAIAALGKRFRKPVWCLEAGHDADLWRKPAPWDKWQNALGLAEAYIKTLSLSGAELMDYWTYEDNYPLVDKASGMPYLAFDVLKAMEGVFGAGATVLNGSCGGSELQALAAKTRTGVLAVLLVNPSGPGKAGIKLAPGARYRISTFTRKGKEESEEVADSDGKVVVAVPTRSVCAVVPAP
ncbi:MAG TPA: hypothetical protein VKT78_15525 [Fimbriimonadaceae bacterium]|nr:hypothetical protein [Fimbriimonadaceae bacterium]